jgi:hypothetical protein
MLKLAGIPYVEGAEEEDEFEDDEPAYTGTLHGLLGCKISFFRLLIAANLLCIKHRIAARFVHQADRPTGRAAPSLLMQFVYIILESMPTSWNCTGWADHNCQ